VSSFDGESSPVATVETDAPEHDAQRGDKAVKKQIRGSSLLLSGKLITVAANFAIQILIVRYLSKSDYGAFAYALSLAAMMATIVTLGLDRSITRFASIYDERGAYDKLLGTIVMQIVAIFGLGLAAIALVYGLEGWLSGSLVDDPKAISLLLILIFLAPINALDGMINGLFAVFSRPRAIFFRRPRAIFFRRHVLSPALRLTVVLLLVLGESSVNFLAAGYVVAGALGMTIYGAFMWRVLRERGILSRLGSTRISVPYREVLSFTFPLLTSDLLAIFLTTSDTVLLGRYGTTADVASFRAIQPAAHANYLIFTSFTLLFTPLASRLFARGDREGIAKLYWSTAIWMAVFTFPIFVLTTSLSGPVTVGLYGERYAGSSTYLALLSIGYFFGAALGFNGLTLKVIGRLRYIVGINVAAAITNVALCLVLIPRYGPLGAAFATASTLVVHNILKQAGLRLGSGISVFEWRYLRVYVSIVVGAITLWGIQQVAEPNFVISLVLAGLVSALIFRVGRTELEIGAVFPEVLRFPLIGRLLGRAPAETR
jgi:O-antigen/teichoic acid export membrane protein